MISKMHELMKTKQALFVSTILVLVLIAIGVLSLTWGTPTLSFFELCKTLLGDNKGFLHILVWEVRLPRFVLGVFAGTLLALSGVLLQDSMRNALAGPELLGVSAGSAMVMAAIIILQLPVASYLQPWLALAGGLIGGGIVAIASWKDQSPVRLILIGMAVSSFLQAFVIVIVSFGGSTTIALFYQYVVGGLVERTWTHVTLILPWLVTIPLALTLARKLNILQMGDEAAKGLGLRVRLVRLCILLLSIALIAPVIAVCGPIGYIALLSPHLTRRLIGKRDASRVLPISALVGAVLLTGADIVARQLFSPVEIPVGVWTTLLGGPLLFILLERQLGRSS